MLHLPVFRRTLSIVLLIVAGGCSPFDPADSKAPVAPQPVAAASAPAPNPQEKLPPPESVSNAELTAAFSNAALLATQIEKQYSDAQNLAAMMDAANQQEVSPKLDGLRKAHTANALALGQQLDKVRARLPLVDVAGDQAVPWTKVHLTANGVFFDAVQFLSPVETGDYSVVFAFATPDFGDRVTWRLASNYSAYQEFSEVTSMKHVVLDGAELPDENVVIFAQAKLMADVHYFIYFEFQDPTPVDLYIKIKQVFPPKVWAGPPQYDAAQELGLLPIKRNALASFGERTRSLIGLKHFEEATTAIEQEMAKNEISPAMQMEYARMAYELGLGDLRLGNQPSAGQRFLKAAAMVRRMDSEKRNELLWMQTMAPYVTEELIQKNSLPHQNFKHHFLARLFYCEACAYAREDQADKALQSLKQSVEAGFDEIDFLVEDEELQSLQNLPAYIQFVADVRTKKIKAVE
jgi:hypothetical protein